MRSETDKPGPAPALQLVPIILARGPLLAPPGTVVIDHRFRRVYCNGWPVNCHKSQHEFRLLRLLFLNGGHITPWAQIIDELWGECENGGPLSPWRGVYVAVHNLVNPALRPLGFKARNVSGQGFRLEPLNAKTGPGVMHG